MTRNEEEAHWAALRAVRCEHDTPGGEQFCIFCLRIRGDSALEKVESLRTENDRLRGCWCKPLIRGAAKVGRVSNPRCPIHGAP